MWLIFILVLMNSKSAENLIFATTTIHVLVCFIDRCNLVS
jgi:hypothetical protein